MWVKFVLHIRGRLGTRAYELWQGDINSLCYFIKTLPHTADRYTWLLSLLLLWINKLLESISQTNAHSMLIQKCIHRHKVQNISLRLQSVESRRYIFSQTQLVSVSAEYSQHVSICFAIVKWYDASELASQADESLLSSEAMRGVHLKISCLGPSAPKSASSSVMLVSAVAAKTLSC